MNTNVEFINLTPHAITLEVNGERETIEPSGKIARVETQEFDLGATANGVPIVERSFGEVEGLPKPERKAFGWITDIEEFNRTAKPGELSNTTIYIVSSLVFAACAHRRDVAAPDTGETAIRDEKGQIVAVRRLIMNRCAVVDNDDCAF